MALRQLGIWGMRSQPNFNQFPLLTRAEHTPSTALLHPEDMEDVRANYRPPLLLTHLGSPLVCIHYMSRKGTSTTGEQCSSFPLWITRGRSLVYGIPDNWLHYFCCGHKAHFHKEHQQLIILSSPHSLAFRVPVWKHFQTNTTIVMTENSSRTVSSWSSCKSAPGRTLLPQLQTGLNDPSKQPALAMVKSIKCSHSFMVCNQPDTNVM